MCDRFGFSCRELICSCWSVVVFLSLVFIVLVPLDCVSWLVCVAGVFVVIKVKLFCLKFKIVF